MGKIWLLFWIGAALLWVIYLRMEKERKMEAVKNRVHESTDVERRVLR